MTLEQILTALAKHLGTPQESTVYAQAIHAAQEETAQAAVVRFRVQWYRDRGRALPPLDFAPQ